MDRAEEEEEKIILQYLEIRQIYERERKTKASKQMNKETKKSKTERIIKGQNKCVIKKE